MEREQKGARRLGAASGGNHHLLTVSSSASLSGDVKALGRLAHNTLGGFYLMSFPRLPALPAGSAVLSVCPACAVPDPPARGGIPAAVRDARRAVPQGRGRGRGNKAEGP